MPANTPYIVTPLAGITSLYRLLVRAVDDPRRKGYVWEILQTDCGRRSIERSSTVFKSMAEAYDDGAVVLGRLNSRQ
jgi:hypothetical protein